LKLIERSEDTLVAAVRLATCLLLCACHAEPAPVAAVPVALPDAPDAVAPTPVPPPTPKEPHVTLTMERSGCFGSCPAYRIAIRDDGLVTYEGLGWVRQHGHVTRHVTPAIADDLIDGYRTASAIPLQTPRVFVTTSDVPTVTFVIEELDGSQKKLVHDTGDSRSPKEWTTFEDRMDEVLRTESLTSCNGRECPR
jgi:hypothetical protein